MIDAKKPKQTAADERRARKLVAERDGGICVRCRRGDSVNWDHRRNRSQGGRWEASNGQQLCGSGTTGCHGWVTQHPEQPIEDGWGVPGWADPAAFPASRWVEADYGTWRLVSVLYDDAGGWTEISEDEAARRRDGRTR